MAIAFDSASSGASDTGTSLLISHTCSGSDRLLVAFSYTNNLGATGISSITFNGASFTRINGVAIGSTGVELWYLVNPSTGTFDVTYTYSASNNKNGAVASYTGVAQSGQPDANNTGSVNPGTSLSVSVTTVADNCWLIGGFAPVQLSPNAGTTQRTAANNVDIYDSNGPKTPPGSYSLGGTFASSNNMGAIASFAPAAAAAAETRRLDLTLLGVG